MSYQQPPGFGPPGDPPGFPPPGYPPQGYGPPPPAPPQGTWWSAIPWPVRALIGVGLVLGISLMWKAANPENRVIVNCHGTGVAIDCPVEHQQGNDTINACWDVVITCANGSRSTAHACQSVTPRQLITKSIPLTEVQNAAACDTSVGMRLENLALTV